ncbi:MAG: PBP1A family penicillin-binding protein [Thermodesulfobacteriota bacterium]
MKRYLFWIVASLLGLALMGLASVAGLIWWASQDLPGFTKITDYTPSLVTTVYARDGRVLGYFYREMRFLVTLDQMSPWLPKAFLAAEDDRFYSHEGVDLAAIARAFVKNLQAGHKVQGGSTITQQVIKQLLLSPEKSYTRKLKEAILAYRLEKNLAKDEILTIYLNQIFFGSRAYGVEAAARVYFGAHARDLTPAQCALLASLPQAPTRYNPFRNPEEALARQRWVLGRMLETGCLNREQYDAALAEKLEFKSMEDPSWRQGAYYLEEVRRRLIERFGEDTVYAAGLHVQSAVDLDHQVAAEHALRKGLEASARRRGWTGPIENIKPAEYKDFLGENPYPAEVLAPGEWVKGVVTAVEQAGAKVLFGQHRGVIELKDMSWARTPDPSRATEEVRAVPDARAVLKPGDVIHASVKEESRDGKGDWRLALEREPDVEGAIVSLDPATGDVLALSGGYSFARSQFNRATQARRQPGSGFKPIVYSAALDNGLTAASMVLDAPIVYTDFDNDRIWKPENYSGVFYGPTLLRTALAKSRNLVTIRVAQQIGIKTIIDRARAMGLESEFPENLSVSLGSSPVSLLNLCQAYTAFARDGSYVKPRLVLEVKSAWGREMLKAEVESVPAISPQTAYLVSTLLKEVVNDGTAVRAKSLGRPLAGKTGTTNDEQDAWFTGFSPYLLTGVYVGFDQVAPMGRLETGSRAALPIWIDYRKAVEENYPVTDFLQPPGIVMARIDAATGLLAGPNSAETYFLPFKEGAQPTDVTPASGSPSGKAEDLLKQVY